MEATAAAAINGFLLRPANEPPLSFLIPTLHALEARTDGRSRHVLGTSANEDTTRHDDSV